MRDEVYVHPRISELHPEVTEQDVLDAWESCIKFVPRLDCDPIEYLAVGMDARGRLIEMIARQTSIGSYIVFHAFTPPTRKMLFELGMVKRR